jgi:hypothetical protein
MSTATAEQITYRNGRPVRCTDGNVLARDPYRWEQRRDHDSVCATCAASSSMEADETDYAERRAFNVA